MSNITNKGRILRALAEAQVEEVTVSYSGSGDSGCIDNVTIVPESASEIQILYPEESQTWNGKWIKKVEINKISLKDAIESLCYTLLEKTHAGWEINDGADGEFSFDLETGEITLNHNSYYTESEHTEHSF